MPVANILFCDGFKFSAETVAHCVEYGCSARSVKISNDCKFFDQCTSILTVIEQKYRVGPVAGFSCTDQGTT